MLWDVAKPLDATWFEPNIWVEPASDSLIDDDLLLFLKLLDKTFLLLYEFVYLGAFIVQETDDLLLFR